MAEKEKVYGVKPKVKVVETNKIENYDEFFTLVTNNQGTKIICGNAVVSRITFSSIKNAKNYIDSKPWELIINVTAYVNDQLKKQQSK